MSTARKPVLPAKPAYEESVRVLREHVDDAQAEMLARRYLAVDESKDGPDLQALKQRLLQPKPVR